MADGGLRATSPASWPAGGGDGLGADTAERRASARVADRSAPAASAARCGELLVRERRGAAGCCGLLRVRGGGEPELQARWAELSVSRGALVLGSSRALVERGGGETVPLSHVHGVTACDNEGEFAVVLKASFRARHGGRERYELRASSASSGAEWVSALRELVLVRAAVYAGVDSRVVGGGRGGSFPEGSIGVQRRSAVCFSGGGARAHVAAAGQLRGLRELGLLGPGGVDYISSVSGSAWCTAIYSFYRKGAASDEELLGRRTAPGELSMRVLSRCPAPLVRVATVDMWSRAEQLFWSTSSHDWWERTLGAVYLEPFGLDLDLPFAHPAMRAHLQARNGHLLRDIVWQREGRPFWLANAVMLGPVAARAPVSLLPLQISAMYTGCPTKARGLHAHSRGHGHGPAEQQKEHEREQAHQHDDQQQQQPQQQQQQQQHHGGSRRSRWSLKRVSASSLLFGGGMVDSFAFGSDVPFEIERSSGEDSGSGEASAPLLESTRAMLEGVLSRVACPEAASAPGRSAAHCNVLVPCPERPFSLRHALGISSSAPAFAFKNHALAAKLNPRTLYWSPLAGLAASAVEARSQLQAPHAPRAQEMDFGDGGSLDNVGLLAMLQRKVQNVVMFCNTEIPIPMRPRSRNKPSSTVRASPAGLPGACSGALAEPLGESFILDDGEELGLEEAEAFMPDCYDWPQAMILPLFGVPMLNFYDASVGDYAHNHVFEADRLVPLLEQLQRCRLQGRAPVARQTLRVLRNEYWGIDGGWDVDLTVFYLGRSAQFESLLPGDTRNEIDLGDKGAFPRFPTYSTFGTKHGTWVEPSLTTEQANLLAAHCEHAVLAQRDTLRSLLLGSPPPPA